MKVKLYHKFVEAARKHAMKRKIARKWLFRRKAYDNQFVCYAAKTITDDYRIEPDDDRLEVVSPASFLSFVCNDFLWKWIPQAIQLEYLLAVDNLLANNLKLQKR